MVNVHIHEFASGKAAIDEAALALFHRQWTAYQKLVDGDFLSHAAVARILHEVLVERFDGPFAFLDIACGDASLAKKALAGTSVRHYQGIDLAAPALELAAKTLEDACYDVDLDHRDYVKALGERTQHADAVWCGLSIHHFETPEKLRLFREIRSVTGDGGIFLLYEPVLGEGEDLKAYLARTWATVPARWVTLTGEEIEQLREHIDTCDLPESAEGWLELGRQAGFTRADQIFADPLNLYRMFRFEP